MPTLIQMVVRKILKNKWLELSLFIGLVIIVSMISSIPVYTDAIMQKMLTRTMEDSQVKSGIFPASYSVEVVASNSRSSLDIYGQIMNLDTYFVKKAQPLFHLPIVISRREMATDLMKWIPLGASADPRRNRNAKIQSIEHLESHIDVIDGRHASSKLVNGKYEAEVFESVLSNLNIVLGDEFVIKQEANSKGKTIAVKIVGIIKPNNNRDLFWNTANISSIYDSALLLPYDLYKQETSVNGTLPIYKALWYWTFQYQSMRTSSADDFAAANSTIISHLTSEFTEPRIESPMEAVLAGYVKNERQVRFGLWALNAPIIILLGWYLFMVTQLLIERQKNEIAVLSSRGASRWQLLIIQLLESLVLGTVSLAIGPFIGLGLVQILGASDGFLAFVRRSALHANLSIEAWEYGLVAILFSITITLIPVWLASDVTIVERKRDFTPRKQRTLWHQYYLDIIMLAIAIYGLFNYRNRMKDMKLLNADAVVFQVDPLLFIVSAIFIIGAGLLALRVYPLFIRLIYRLRRKLWSPHVYITLLQVGRLSKQYQFVMIFLILTTALGIFSSGAARTVNNNVEEQIRYRNGADLILQTLWSSEQPSSHSLNQNVRYIEPPQKQWIGLPGVEQATQVFVKDKVTLNYHSSNSEVALLGIRTDEFGKTVWFPNGLLSHHLNEYLNLIAVKPSAVLISEALANKRGINVGDQLQMSWPGSGIGNFVVYGIIPYFPSMDPSSLQIIGNIDYIKNRLRIEPYQIWMKLAVNQDKQQLFDELQRRQIPLTHITDTGKELAEASKDPTQLVMNGGMTLGFIIAMLISFIGFLIFWILSLYKRTLQLGIFGALGMSVKQILGIIAMEQLLISFVAVCIGAIIGEIASNLYVPLFEMLFSTSLEKIPFHVIHNTSDHIKTFGLILFMISMGIAILGYLISRIQIHQALKLGED